MSLMAFSLAFSISDWMFGSPSCFLGLGPSFCVWWLKSFEIFALCTKIIISYIAVYINYIIHLCGFHWHSRNSICIPGWYIFLIWHNHVVYREFLWPQVRFLVKYVIFMVPAICNCKNHSHSGIYGLNFVIFVIYDICRWDPIIWEVQIWWQHCLMSLSIWKCLLCVYVQKW